MDCQLSITRTKSFMRKYFPFISVIRGGGGRGKRFSQRIDKTTFVTGNHRRSRRSTQDPDTDIEEEKKPTHRIIMRR